MLAFIGVSIAAGVTAGATIASIAIGVAGVALSATALGLSEANRAESEEQQAEREEKQAAQLADQENAAAAAEYAAGVQREQVMASGLGDKVFQNFQMERELADPEGLKKKHTKFRPTGGTTPNAAVATNDVKSHFTGKLSQYGRGAPVVAKAS